LSLPATQVRAVSSHPNAVSLTDHLGAGGNSPASFPASQHRPFGTDPWMRAAWKADTRGEPSPLARLPVPKGLKVAGQRKRSTLRPGQMALGGMKWSRSSARPRVQLVTNPYTFATASLRAPSGALAWMRAMRCTAAGADTCERSGLAIPEMGTIGRPASNPRARPLPAVPIKAGMNRPDTDGRSDGYQMTHSGSERPRPTRFPRANA